MFKKLMMLTLVVCFGFGSGFGQSADADDLTYYMDLEEALKKTPQTETKWLSKEYGMDLTQWPIPWKEQVRNGITNSGFSPSGDYSHRNEYWVPFDKIPGEDSFPMKMRLKLSARRGYQKEVVHSQSTLGAIQNDFSKEMKSITDDYSKGVKDRMAAFMAESEALKQKNRDEMKEDLGHLGEVDLTPQERDHVASTGGDLSEFLIQKYEAECKSHFPDSSGGCDMVASSLVGNNLNKYLVPLKQIYKNDKIKDGDVSLTYPGGRALLRMDPNGWVTNYKDPREDLGAPNYTKVSFEKLEKKGWF